ncbi:MAG: alpha/beta hydrolase [Pseudomonadota bacterium]
MNAQPAPLALDAAAYPPTGSLIDVAGTQVHVHREGRVDNPAVVLVHGASGNSRDYSFDLAPRLAEEFHVIAVDRPGHGHSPALHDEGESPAEQAAVLDAALEALGIQRAVIVGHSYGGAVAMAWALEHPARVAGVVSLGGATMPWPGGLGSWYRIASSRVGGATVVPLVSSLATRGIAERSAHSIFAPQAPPEGYLSYVGVGLSLRPETLRTNARQVNTLKPHVTEMAARYSDLALPVEVVHGSADTIVPADVHGARMVALIPGAKLTLLDDVGHMPHHADPEAAVTAIRRVAAKAGLR